MTASLPGHGPIDTIICDIDGVVLLGSQPIVGAKDALEQMRAAGLSVVFATNNSSRPPAAARRHVRSIVGFDPGPDAVVNSGVATARFIVDKVERVYLLGSAGLRETLEEAGIALTDDWREADAVVAGIDRNLVYEDFANAGLAVQNGATFYATNSDGSFPRPDGLYPGAGAIAAVVERTTGVSPIVCGKPHAPMRAALQRTGGEHPLIVGDRFDTDIALGKAEGWATALVLTGVTQATSEVPAALQPDITLNSIGELPAALGVGRS